MAYRGKVSGASHREKALFQQIDNSGGKRPTIEPVSHAGGHLLRKTPVSEVCTGVCTP
jgi:hypothetical protein